MTSIEWLAEMVSKMGYVSADIVEQAKEMHKAEIIEACNSGYDSWFDVIEYNSKGEQYYQETFKKD